MQRLALSLCVLAASCASTVAYRNPEPGDMYSMDQRIGLPEVRRRLGRISVGMPLQDVFRILGEPGTVWHNGLAYHELGTYGAKVLGSKKGEVRIGTDGKVVTEIHDILNASGLYGVGGG